MRMRMMTALMVIWKMIEFGSVLIQLEWNYDGFGDAFDCDFEFWWWLWHYDFDDDFDMMMIESGNLLIRLERSVKQEATQTLGHSDTQS